MKINFVGSKNFQSGRTSKGKKYTPVMIVNHIMAGTFAGTLSWFNNPSAKVSAHFGISKKGEIDQYVKLGDTAWHCAPIRNPLIKLPYDNTINPNLYTIGIEWEGYPGDVPTDAQYQAGLWLHKELMKDLPKKPLKELIVGHFQINSVNRPDDPGKGFPWDRLYKDLDVSKGPSVLIKETGERYSSIIVENTMYAPVRKVAESAGLNVYFDSSSQTAILFKGTLGKISLPPFKGPSVFIASTGERYSAVIVENTMYAPVRKVSESAGLNVLFDSSTQTAILSKKK